MARADKQAEVFTGLKKKNGCCGDLWVFKKTGSIQESLLCGAQQLEAELRNPLPPYYFILMLMSVPQLMHPPKYALPGY